MYDLPLPKRKRESYIIEKRYSHFKRVPFPRFDYRTFIGVSFDTVIRYNEEPNVPDDEFVILNSIKISEFIFDGLELGEYLYDRIKMNDELYRIFERHFINLPFENGIQTIKDSCHIFRWLDKDVFPVYSFNRVNELSGDVIFNFNSEFDTCEFIAEVLEYIERSR